MNKNVIIEAISYLLILLLLYTGIFKIIQFDTFKADISQTLGWTMGPIVADIFPFIELAIAAMLFIPKMQKWGLYSAFALMTFLTLYVAYILAFITRHNRPCTCGGIIRNMSWRQHLFFNIVFTILAVVGIWLYKSRLPQTTGEYTKERFA